MKGGTMKSTVNDYALMYKNGVSLEAIHLIHKAKEEKTKQRTICPVCEDEMWEAKR